MVVQLGEKAFKPETTVQDSVFNIHKLDTAGYFSGFVPKCNLTMNTTLKMDPEETLSRSSFNVSIVCRNVHF